MYQSLGCYHTLQPRKDPFIRPSVPALTPQGFVRWQTVQLLLEPEQHVPFLQKAVKRFEIINPGDGRSFPRLLPKDSLPCRPDLQMVEWHENVSQKLRLEAQLSRLNGFSRALSDEEPDSSVASINDHPNAGATSCSFEPHTHPFGKHPTGSSHQQRNTREGPWSPERRRHHSNLQSVPRRHNNWWHNSVTATDTKRSGDHPRGRARSPSIASATSSSSNSSSYTASSPSLSPKLRPPHSSSLHPPPLAPQRRHSASAQCDSSANLRRSETYCPPPLLRPQTSYFPHSLPQGPLVVDSSGPPRFNAKGLNVRWPNVAELRQLQSGTFEPPGEAIGLHFVKKSQDRAKTFDGYHDRTIRRSVSSVGEPTVPRGKGSATDRMNWR